MKSEKKFTAELERLLRDSERLEMADKFIDQVMEDVRNGHDQKKINASRSSDVISNDVAIEVARSRLKVREKFTKWNRLWLDSYSASYSTPEIIGRWRAERLSPSRIVDVGCGAGMQTLFFSENSDVISIEVSRLRSIMARLNATVYSYMPKKIINADYTSVVDSLDIDNETVIFSDPLRPQTEHERTLATLVPSPLVLNKMLSGKTENFVFDLPPQMSWDNITLKGEKEYISINGKINRLSLYMGKTAKQPVSAIMFPANVRITGEPSDHHFKPAEKTGENILVPDTSLTYAGLLSVLEEFGNLREISSAKRRTVLTMEGTADTFFPGEVFEVVDLSDESNLISRLKANDAGRVIPRFFIEPEEYYGFREDVEKQLSGSSDLYLFKAGTKYAICRLDVSNDSKPVKPEWNLQNSH